MKRNADKSIYPASMTKIMTSIIAFELIKKKWRFKFIMINL